MAIIDKIKSWYRGRYAPPPPNEPNSKVVFVSAGHYEQPVLARAIGALARFWLSHWQWIIGTTLAVFALLVAL